METIQVIYAPHPVRAGPPPVEEIVPTAVIATALYPQSKGRSAASASQQTLCLRTPTVTATETVRPPASPHPRSPRRSGTTRPWDSPWISWLTILTI